MINVENLYKIDQINNYINQNLFEKHIYNISTPTLFYSFPEYGEDEMYVKCYRDTYFLPQSHEYFTSYISLFFEESVYSVEKCYRKEQNNTQIKALEFRQLCICLYDTSIQQGLTFIKKFLYELIRINLGGSINFTTISYRKSIERYCDDAPDLRYGEYYLRKGKVSSEMYTYDMYIKKSDVENVEILNKMLEYQFVNIKYRNLQEEKDSNVPLEYNLIISLFSKDPDITYSIKLKFSKIRKLLINKEHDYEVVIINS